MALDVGSKTIGVALSDALQITVRPLLTLARSGLAEDTTRVLRLVEEHNVGNLLVGRPLHLNGQESETLEQIRPLVSNLRRLGISVQWAEERLSTKEAEQIMGQLELPIRERRRRRNEFAAAVILEWHLRDSSV